MNNHSECDCPYCAYEELVMDSLETIDDDDVRDFFTLMFERQMSLEMTVNTIGRALHDLMPDEPRRLDD